MADENTPIPLLSQYTAMGLKYGVIHGERLLQPSGAPGSYYADDANGKLGAIYYDAGWALFQLKDLLSDTRFEAYAQEAIRVYSAYLDAASPQYQATGWRLFGDAYYHDWIRNGDATSKNYLIQLSQKASFATDSTPLSSIQHVDYSREVSYALRVWILAEKVGEARRVNFDAYVDTIFGHFRQWFVDLSAPYIRPFMVWLSSHALIDFYMHAPDHPRASEVIPTLIQAWDHIWNTCWLAVDKSLQYTDRVVSSGGTEPAPDLNLLIVPVFGFLWWQTGEERFRLRGDLLFEGGVTIEDEWGFITAGGYAAGDKQFFQMYRASQLYIQWATSAPVTEPGTGPGPNVPNPLEDSGVAAMYLPVKNETWEHHFSINGWNTIQDALNTGFPIFLQPAADSAVFEETVDMESTVLQGTLVSLIYNPEEIDGTVTILPTISLSEDNVTFTDYVGETQVFASNFQYVKIRLEATAADPRSLIKISEIRLRVAAKEKRDAGSGNAESGDTNGTPVLFNKPFVDVDSITVTPKYRPDLPASEQPIAVYDFTDIANPTGFTVFLFKASDGTRLGGEFSWTAKGV